MAPFAGIAFLWFLAVVRDRIGVREDRFLSTVFLGSGLLFVAMFWAAGASIASLVAGNRFESGPPLSATDLQLFRSLAFSFLFVFAARAAAVFMIVTSTIALRTAVFPRWLVIAGYVIALVMLLSLSALQWVVLLFPVWVFVLSLFILNSEIRAGRAKPAGRASASAQSASDAAKSASTWSARRCALALNSSRRPLASERVCSHDDCALSAAALACCLASASARSVSAWAWSIRCVSCSWFSCDWGCP